MPSWRPPRASRSDSSAGGGHAGSEPLVKKARVEGDVLALAVPGSAEGDNGKSKGKGAGKGKHKKRGKKAKPQMDAQMTELLTLLTKTTLSNTQRTRELHGVMFDTVIMSSEAGVVKGVKAEGARYAAACQAAGAGHKYGPPHPTVWAALVEELVKEDVGARTRQALKEYSDKLAAMQQDAITMQVRQCRWEKCYDAEKTKLVLAVEGTGVREEVLAALVQLGGVVRSGRPSPGQLERELEDWLHVLSS